MIQNQKELDHLLKKYQNVASFQFVDAVTSLLTSKYNFDCNKFSLKDKAHIRNLIRELEAEASEKKRGAVTLKKELMPLKKGVSSYNKCERENRALLKQLEDLQGLGLHLNSMRMAESRQ